MKLWVCPNGRHPAVRGPERPRKFATVRFCLGCSEGASQLVERVAPALVRQRSAAKVSRVQRAKEARVKTAAASERGRTAYPGGWLREWHAVIGGLAAWPRALGPVEIAATFRTAHPRKEQIKGARWGTDVVDTTGRLWPAGSSIGEGVSGPVYHLRPAEVRTSGHAYGKRRIVLTAGTNRADALATLVHELAHCAVGYAGGPHSDAWRSTFVAAAEELSGRSIVGVELDGLRCSALRVHDQVRVLFQQAGLGDVTDPRSYRVP